MNNTYYDILYQCPKSYYFSLLFSSIYPVIVDTNRIDSNMIANIDCKNISYPNHAIDTGIPNNL